MVTTSEAANPKSEDKLTQADLEKLDAHNPEMVPNLFYIMTGTNKSTMLPMEMRNDKTICAKAFSEMHQELGSPLKGWKEKNWPKAAAPAPTPLTAWAYEFRCQDTIIKEIVWYADKAHPVAVQVAIDTSFSIIEPWDTCRAKAVGKNGQAKYVLCELWPAGRGPRSRKPKDINKRLADVAVALQARVQKEADDLQEQAMVDDTTFIGEDRKRAQKEALKKAAEESRQTDKRRRCID